MDKITQGNAANAEESAAASEELSSQAESLARIVRDLATLVQGGGRNYLRDIAVETPKLPLAHSTESNGLPRATARAAGQLDKTFREIRPS